MSGIENTNHALDPAAAGAARSSRGSLAADVALWMLFVVVGWAISWLPGVSQRTMLSAWAITSGAWDLTYPALSAVGGLAGGLLGGLLLGLGQWRALRRVRLPAAAWLGSTVVGTGFGWSGAAALELFLLAALRHANGGTPGVQLGSDIAIVITSEAAAVMGAFVGASVGIAQWMILHRRVRYAAAWIGATMAAWAMAGTACWLIYGLGGDRSVSGGGAWTREWGPASIHQCWLAGSLALGSWEW
jgi:hypothetical protein